MSIDSHDDRPRGGHCSLTVLLLVSGVFNAVGALILVVAPARLDSALGLSANADFLWHLLAACSLSFAVLSFLAIQISERQALRGIVLTLMVFHAASAVVSIWGIFEGLPAFVWANTAIHVMFLGLFWALGLRRHNP